MDQRLGKHQQWAEHGIEHVGGDQHEQQRQAPRLEPYGMIILIILIVTGALSYVLGPRVIGTINFIYSAFGLA